VDPVVVIPSAVRHEPVPSALSELLVCGDPVGVLAAEHATAGLGTQTRVLSSGAQLRDYADRHSPPETCVLVTPLPDGPVLPLIRMLRSRGWQRVLVLSSHADARAVYAALLAGVRGVVVHAQTTPSTRPAAISRDALVKLSDRELEVLRMVADGQTNRAVGERLGLSGLTVKSHLARIARKLGSGDRAQMVATAIRQGYIH
jgi:DNA-binding NarL/FixJ family response regulator